MDPVGNNMCMFEHTEHSFAHSAYSLDVEMKANFITLQLETTQENIPTNSNGHETKTDMSPRKQKINVSGSRIKGLNVNRLLFEFVFIKKRGLPLLVKASR